MHQRAPLGLRDAPRWGWRSGVTAASARLARAHLQMASLASWFSLQCFLWSGIPISHFQLGPRRNGSELALPEVPSALPK